MKGEQGEECMVEGRREGRKWEWRKVQEEERREKMLGGQCREGSRD